ncbi:CYFA0S13e03026g1_1 [Cyberlindnera fabianii]|uniref:CYFA0S13e03026g1_1 n=1 Tax=Cyberlindnera fabianii TaxID=36022 RepID=A0A061B2R4_CYBFA|nr:CYFA0S13e03026g1_1 [Cyberlindnera fabianii]
MSQTLRSFHTKGCSDASSIYSEVLSLHAASTNSEPTLDDSVSVLKPDPSINYQITNPYANSLWYNTRGEVGNETINDIKQRVAKRKLEEAVKPPARLESLSSKKIDSPISNEAFFNGFDNVDCPSPKYKGLKTPDTEHRNATEKKYGHALKELITTEIKYHEDLTLTKTVYRSILHSNKKYKHILSSKQEAVIFSNLETICDLSGLFIRDVTKVMSRSCNGYFDFDINKHFGLVDVSSVDIGDFLKSYFIRLSIAYTSYFESHRKQMEELEQCTKYGGPNVSKWLNECEYLAKAKSDCWSLEALLIQPIQRLPSYLLMIDSLLESSDEMSYEYIEQLYDAKTYLEKLLDKLNSRAVILAADESTTDKGLSMNKPSIELVREAKTYLGKLRGDRPSKIPVPPDSQDLEPLMVLQDRQNKRAQLEKAMINIRESRQEYVDLVNQFKTVYTNLKHFKKELKTCSQSLFKSVEYQKSLVEKWRAFMEYEDNDLDNYYIKSIYSSYSEKVSDQEAKTKIVSMKIEEKLGKALELALENCAAVKYRIKKHNNSRGAYVRYLKHQGHMSETQGFEAQEYIAIENQIKEDLPPLLEKMSQFFHYTSLMYSSIIQEWFKMMAGGNQLEVYQDALRQGDLEMGDNFDIIEIYSTSKHSTRLALKDMCSREAPYSEVNSALLRIHRSKVVRRLFGI